MKKLILFLGFCIAFLNVSCDADKILDQPLQGRQQLDDFFSSSENAKAFVNSIYQMVNGTNWNQVNFQRQINFLRISSFKNFLVTSSTLKHIFFFILFFYFSNFFD